MNADPCCCDVVVCRQEALELKSRIDSMATVNGDSSSSSSSSSSSRSSKKKKSTTSSSKMYTSGSKSLKNGSKALSKTTKNGGWYLWDTCGILVMYLWCTCGTRLILFLRCFLFVLFFRCEQSHQISQQEIKHVGDRIGQNEQRRTNLANQPLRVRQPSRQTLRVHGDTVPVRRMQCLGELFFVVFVVFWPYL